MTSKSKALQNSFQQISFLNRLRPKSSTVAYIQQPLIEKLDRLETILRESTNEDPEADEDEEAAGDLVSDNGWQTYLFDKATWAAQMMGPCMWFLIMMIMFMMYCAYLLNPAMWSLFGGPKVTLDHCKADLWRPIFMSEADWVAYTPTHDEWIQYTEVYASWIFFLCTPARWVLIALPLEQFNATSFVGGFNEFAHWPSAPRNGTQLDETDDQSRQIPYLPTFASAEDVNEQVLLNRAYFWKGMLACQITMMIAGTLLTHIIFIQIPRAIGYAKERDRQLEDDLQKNIRNGNKTLLRLKGLFFGYHLSHNLALFMMTCVAVANGYLSIQTGWDWELWSAWITWVAIVINVTAIVKYAIYWGQDIPWTFGEIAMTLVPGVGNDAHLAKDWAFVGLCFQRAHCAPYGTFDEYMAGLIGFTSMFTIFVPMQSFAPRPKLKANTSVDDLAEAEMMDISESFIAAHWPIVMACPRYSFKDTPENAGPSGWLAGSRASYLLPSKSKEVQSNDGQDFRTMSTMKATETDAKAQSAQGITWTKYFRQKMTQYVVGFGIPQTTVGKEMVASKSEFPQGLLEGSFALYFGFSGFLIAALIMSSCKAGLINIFRRVLALMVFNSGSKELLVAYAKANRFARCNKQSALTCAIQNEDLLKKVLPELVRIPGAGEEVVPPDAFEVLIATLRSWFETKEPNAEKVYKFFEGTFEQQTKGVYETNAERSFKQAVCIAVLQKKYQTEGSTVSEFRSSGASLNELLATFPLKDLAGQYYTVNQLKAAGVTAKAFKDEDALQYNGLKYAFTRQEWKECGVNYEALEKKKEERDYD